MTPEGAEPTKPQLSDVRSRIALKIGQGRGIVLSNVELKLVYGELATLRQKPVEAAAPSPSQQTDDILNRLIETQRLEFVKLRKVFKEIAVLASAEVSPHEAIEIRAASSSVPAQPATPTISLEVYQHDWIPGFASFHSNGDRTEGAVKHVVINLGSLLSAVQSADLDAKEN